MAIDPELARAVRDSTRRADQPAEVAERLINWLERQSEEELDTEAQREFLKGVYDAIDASGWKTSP